MEGAVKPSLRRRLRARRTPSSPLWQVLAVLALAGAVVWAWMLEMRVWP